MTVILEGKRDRWDGEDGLARWKTLESSVKALFYKTRNTSQGTLSNRKTTSQNISTCGNMATGYILLSSLCVQSSEASDFYKEQGMTFCRRANGENMLLLLMWLVKEAGGCCSRRLIIPIGVDNHFSVGLPSLTWILAFLTGILPVASKACASGLRPERGLT